MKRLKQRTPSGHRHRAILATALALAPLLTMSGCNYAGVLAYMIAGTEREVEYEAQYRGLDNKTGAVMVIATPEVYGKHPEAVERICSATTLRLAENIPGARFVDPKQVVAYQVKNPYWNTVPYDKLIKELKVDRLVYVDVSNYQVHEPGNPHLKQGEIAAGIGIVEAENPQPDRFAFYTPIISRFPDKTSRKSVSGKDETIELATLALFSRDVENLFRDHVKVEKR